ncbi:hypothetical protein SCHPADRAFT_801756, partial [Schizopora paradoxa]
DSPIPETFWPEMYSHANFLHNISPSSSLNGKTPWEAYHGTKPDVSNLRAFWSNVYILMTPIDRKKLDPH